MTGGMGGMGGAQPLAATMNGAAFLGVDVDAARIRRRVDTGYCDRMTTSLDEAISWVNEATRTKSALSVGLVGNCAEVLPEMARRGLVPDVLTDQTSAHDPLNGYIPAGYSVDAAARLRASDPGEYVKRSLDSIAVHVRAMLDLKRAGAITFDYGNNIRRMAADRGVTDAFDIPGFVPEYIRPLFCEGRGPFRWVALSGDPADIAVTDAAVCRLFPENESLTRWIALAREHVQFQGLPARICWLGYGERAEFALEINRLIAKGEIQAPIVIGRDHLDCGSVASPYRETEAMRDGSDAIADWPILNALLNTAAGASWVSVHNGGGVGIGYSQHAGQVTVVDGTEESGKPCGARDDVRSRHRSAAACGRRLHGGSGVRGQSRAANPDGMSRTLLVRGARQVVTLRGQQGPRRGAAMRDLGILENAAVLISDGRIVEVGDIKAPDGADVLDAAGKVVLPGFVDSHTHLVWIRPRLLDYEMRIAGRYLCGGRRGGRRNSVHGKEHARGFRRRAAGACERRARDVPCRRDHYHRSEIGLRP